MYRRGGVVVVEWGGGRGLIACAVEENRSAGMTKCTLEGRDGVREGGAEGSKKCSEEPAAACDGQM